MTRIEAGSWQPAATWRTLGTFFCAGFQSFVSCNHLQGILRHRGMLAFRCQSRGLSFRLAPCYGIGVRNFKESDSMPFPMPCGRAAMTQREKKMKTGQDVNQDGVYSSDCCLHEKELAKKQSFPRCPKCMSLTEWFP